MDERFLDVDQHGVLRIPGVFWLSLILLIRHWIWFFVTLFSSQYGGTGDGETLHVGMSWWLLVAQLPAVVLIFVAGRRSPDGGKLIRALWRRGAFLVGVTVCLNLAWAAVGLSLASEWRMRPELVVVCFSLLDLAIGWSLCLSSHTRQLFGEFPEPAAALSKG